VRTIQRSAILLLAAAAALSAAESRLVSTGADGRLVYRPYTPEGDTLPDFSSAGYKAGGTALPEAPVRLAVEPVPGDNTSHLQAALDQLARLPAGPDGWRGALLLRRGRYALAQTLRVAASGIVLRGEGEGVDGTVLIATRRARYNLIEAGGDGEWQQHRADAVPIAPAYVPVGARSLTVENVAHLRVGDTVLVHRPSPRAWIAAIGMDQLPPRHDGAESAQWKPGSKDLNFDRTIVAIAGRTITFDAPLTNALQREYGGGEIVPYAFPARLTLIGIENLRLESEFDPAVKMPGHEGATGLMVPADENHAWNGIYLKALQDGWVRHVTSVAFGGGCVSVGPTARRVTIAQCSCLDPVSQVEGGRRYAFSIGGQLVLVRDCYARRARHAFVIGPALVPGPNVFLDCVGEETYSTSEPHQRWSVGALWDNVSIDGPRAWLQAINRGWMGTGHGWAGAQMLFWNCSAAVIAVERPPTGQNFAVGLRRRFDRPGTAEQAARNMNDTSGTHFAVSAPFVGDGYQESPDAPVTPRSLYLAQLAERARVGRE